MSHPVAIDARKSCLEGSAAWSSTLQSLASTVHSIRDPPVGRKWGGPLQDQGCDGGLVVVPPRYQTFSTHRPKQIVLPIQYSMFPKWIFVIFTTTHPSVSNTEHSTQTLVPRRRIDSRMPIGVVAIPFPTAALPFRMSTATFVDITAWY